MRSVGSPSVTRFLGATVITLATVALSLAGCSDDPVRTSGKKNGSGAANSSGGDGSSAGGSSSGSTASPGGSEGTGAVGATAGTDPGTGGTGPSAGTSGTAGDVGTAGTTPGSGGDTTGAGGTGTSGSTSSGGSGGTMPCQMASYTFAPKIPTVFMLVDQSGSMFACQNGGALDPSGTECADQSDTSWYPLRAGALELIEALQAEVRFGFAPLGGTQQDSCPNPEPVLPDFNNYAAIAERYNGLQAILNGETPVAAALAATGEILLADEAPGDKFILFVTDGEPDYCNNGDGLCPADSAVFRLQTLYEAGVQTLVFGLPASGMFGMNAPSILAAFANAGSGQPAVRPGGYDEFRLWDECNFKAPWAADLELSGKPAERGSELGNYSETGGTAVVYQPDPTNQEQLIELLSTALSSVKSCTFDLSNVDGQSIKVDLNKLAEASVAIEGTVLPQDATNGWSMMSQTQLLLNGTACDTWRLPEKDDISFNFPCNTIIFE
jgi:hypothetical protein